MTTPTPDTRRLTVPLRPDLYNLLSEHCAEQQVPMTVFVRELIKRAILPSTHA